MKELNFPLFNFRAATILAASLFVVTTPLQAATFVWDGNGPGTAINTSGNWVGDPTAPVAGDANTYQFGSATNRTMSLPTGNWQFSEIEFLSSANGAYELGTTYSPTTNRFQSGVATINQNSGFDAWIQAAIFISNGPLTISGSGAGTLTLSGIRWNNNTTHFVNVDRNLTLLNITSTNTGYGIVQVAGGQALTYGGTAIAAGTLRLNYNTGAATTLIASNASGLAIAAATQATGSATFGGVNAITLNGTYTQQGDGDATIGFTNTGGTTFNANTVFGAATGTASRTITLDSAVNTLATFSGVISGNAGAGVTSVTKTGSGAVLFANANTYSGTTTLNQGTLSAGNDSALGTGTLALNGGKLSSDSITARTFANAVTLGGDVTLGDATNSGLLTFDGAGTLTGNRALTTDSDVTFANALGGVGFGVNKLGSGTLTFSAANTYTGNTLVSAGTLVLSGSGSIAGSATVTVQNGAVLDASTVTGGVQIFGTGQTVMGRGTVIGDTVIQGTLAPGNSPGILTFNDDLTLGLDADSIMEMENALSPVRGTDYDGVNVGGLLTYGGTLTLTMSALISGGTYNLFDFGSFAGNFSNVTFAGGIYAGTFSYNAGFWTAADTNGSGQVFNFELASGDLIVSAIPEPSATLLLTAGLMVVVLLRRRSH